MDNEILYDPNAIGGLVDVQDQHKKLDSIREELNNIFSKLRPAFTGAAAQSLDAAHTRSDNSWQELHAQVDKIQSEAIGHHGDMHNLDSKLSTAF